MGQIHREVHEESGNPIDLISVCTPDHLHGREVIAGLRAGKRVFCEKPICTTRKDFDLIHELLQRGKGTLGCNFPLRFTRQFQRLKALIENDAFGQVYHVNATYHWGRRHKLDTTWRADDPEYSYMLGGGIHMIDLVKWLFGCKMKPLGLALENWAIQTGAFALENGAICTIIADFGSDRGDHWHEITIRGTETCLTVRHETETDKKAALRAFISGEPTPTSSEIMEVMDCALTLAGR